MPRAVGLTDELLQGWAPIIETVELIPSSSGRFEVTVDDDLVFSKAQLGRHAEPGEVAAIVRERWGPEIEREWQSRARGILRAELARRNLNYVDLAERLGVIGIVDNPKNLSNKIARGMFTAAFFMQCMDAIGCRLRIEDE